MRLQHVVVVKKQGRRTWRQCSDSKQKGKGRRGSLLVFSVAPKKESQTGERKGKEKGRKG